MKVNIIDYGAGNIAGLAGAFREMGVEVVDGTDADALVLPGVGHFAWCADRLRASGQAERVRTWSGPLLAICVGMQLLFEESEEGPAKGLGILPGKVVRLKAPRLPHVGWNEVAPYGYMYFSHSYGVDPFSLGDVKALATDYYDVVIALVKRGNILGVQFHPEKSGQVGLAFLRQWAESV